MELFDKIDTIHCIFIFVSFLFMSCFNETSCVSNELYHRINCNYTLLYFVYSCNITTTCKRDFDAFYDCCTDDIRHCTIVSLNVDLLPTTLPTPGPTTSSVNMCEDSCNSATDSTSCKWFELPNIDEFCYDYDSRFCCFHSHDDCCMVPSVYFATIYLFIGFVLCCCLYYKCIIHNHYRVRPNNPIHETISHDDHAVFM